VKNDTVDPLYLRILDTVRKGFSNLFNERGGDEEITPEYIATLPEDIKADPVFAKYKDANEAHRGLVAAQKFLGRESLPVPKDENDTEAISMFHKKLGHPENAEAYKIPTDLEIPKDFPMDEEMVKGFRTEAHKLGMSPKQFDGLYKFYMNYGIGQFSGMNENNEKIYNDSVADLHKKWGGAYGQNVALANKVYDTFVPPEGIAAFKQGIGNHPVVIEAFSNIGKVMSEDLLIGKGQGLTQTPAEADAEIKTMEADTKSPLHNASDPRHQEFVEKRARLYKLKLGQ